MQEVMAAGRHEREQGQSMCNRHELSTLTIRHGVKVHAATLPATSPSLSVVVFFMEFVQEEKVSMAE